MKRKLFPVTILAVAVLLVLGRCAPTVEPSSRPPTPVPTPASGQPVSLVEEGSVLMFCDSIDEWEVNA